VLETAIERQNVAGVELISHFNQAGIGESGWRLAGLIKDFPDPRRSTGKLKRYPKVPIAEIFHQTHCGSVDRLQQITGFGID
jgi:hypothetical protein